MVRACGTMEEHSHRIDERDWREGRDEMGIQSAHVALFSHLSCLTRHGLRHWWTFSASCEALFYEAGGSS